MDKVKEKLTIPYMEEYQEALAYSKTHRALFHFEVDFHGTLHDYV